MPDYSLNNEPHRDINYPDIIVNKQDEFFIAAGKLHLHSFVMLGVIQNSMPILLAKVGKTNSSDPEFGTTRKKLCKMTFKMAFSEAIGVLQAEKLSFCEDMSYSANTSSYAHYLQFIHLLRLASAEQNKPLYCYQPISEDETSVCLRYQILEATELKPTVEEQRIIDRSHTVKLFNNCRTTALDLIDYSTNHNGMINHLSSFFYAEYPLANPNQHFYILPLPPSAYDNDGAKSALLTRIYQQMEKLLKIDPYGDCTIHKFEALKALYIEQAGIATGDINEALRSIMDWKKKHHLCINQFRRLDFFTKLFVSKTATANMADEIELSLKMRIMPA